MRTRKKSSVRFHIGKASLLFFLFCCLVTQAQKKPNILILMTDDTGWGDFGYVTGRGAALGHATPNIDRLAKEGAVFSNWYGQASYTAGRCSFITGRILMVAQINS